MITTNTVNLTLDRRLLRHPRAYHLRRMRAGIWLYLDLLARLLSGAETVEVEPAVIAAGMGLPEPTIRSWLGHLRKAGYVAAERLNGKVLVTIKKGFVPDAPVTPKERFFTVAKLQRMLKDKLNVEAFEAALKLYPDPVIRRALAGALAPPEERIHRSRTALFLYLLKNMRNIAKKADTILALDPGLRALGWAVLSDKRLLASGVLPLRFHPAPSRLSPRRETRSSA
jgi:DNA-binding transcriptional ArsR family regulator